MPLHGPRLRGLEPSQTWTVLRHSVIIDGDAYDARRNGIEPPFVRFHVSPREDLDYDVDEVTPRGNDLEYAVDVSCRYGGMQVSCQYHFTETWGYPFRHIMAVCSNFRDVFHTDGSVTATCVQDYVKVLPLFDNYWLRDRSGWMARIPQVCTPTNDDDDRSGDGGTDPDNLCRDRLRKEKKTASALQNMRNLTDLLLRKSEVRGPGWIEHVMTVLHQVSDSLDAGRVPQPSAQHTTAEALGILQNPNQAHARYRGAWGRKKPRTERKGIKKAQWEHKKKQRTN